MSPWDKPLGFMWWVSWEPGILGAEVHAPELLAAWGGPISLGLSCVQLVVAPLFPLGGSCGG